MRKLLSIFAFIFALIGFVFGILGFVLGIYGLVFLENTQYDMMMFYFLITIINMFSIMQLKDSLK